MHVHAVFGVEILLERQNDHHFIDIALDLLDAAFLPRPNLGRDVVNDLDMVLFGEFGDAQVEAWKIDQHEHVGFPVEDIGFAAFHVAQHLFQMHKNLPEPHVGHVAVVDEQLGAGGAHQVAAAAAKLSCGIFLQDGFDEIGGVQIARRLPGHNVILHRLFYWANSRFTMSDTCLLSALPANVLVAMPITLPMSFMPLKPLSAMMPWIVASTSSGVSICGR